MKNIFMLLTILFMLFSSQAFANTVNFTGSLSDWGLTGGNDGTAISWENPSAGIFSFVDPDRVKSTGFVDPGWGGKNFDAYAMYYTNDSQKAYFGIVTGFPQTGNPPGYSGYATGDLALQFPSLSDPYNVTYQYGVRLNTTTDGLHGSGAYTGIYQVKSWKSTSFAQSAPSVINSYGNLLGYADVVYGNNTSTGGDPLYLYEIAIPLGLMDGSNELFAYNQDFNAHWTMSCGNDVLNGKFVVTPEPASMLLFGIGAGTLWLRRRKQKA